jgi:hypothetical protein
MENLNVILDTITEGVEEIRKAMVKYPHLTTDIKYLPVAGPLTDHTVVVIIEVIRTEDDFSMFLFDLALTQEPGEEPQIMSFGFDPCKPEDDMESGTVASETEDYSDSEYCPDQVTAYSIEEISKTVILNDFFKKMVTVIRYGINCC